MIENVETKSFTQIWEALTTDDRLELTGKLLRARCCTTYQTVWNWGKGKTRPPFGLVRDKVTATISSFLKIKTDAKTLFPQT